MPEPSAAAVLGWIARGKAIATKSFRDDAVNWMLSSGAPERAVRIVKAPVGAGSTNGSDTGDYGISIGAWSDSMRTQSAFYRIFSDGGFTRVPVNTRVGITVAPVAGVVVAEGHAIPLSPISLRNVMLSPIKASSLIVVTDELLRDVTSSGQQALNRALMGAVSDAVDAAFLDLVVNTGTPSTPSSGTTANDARLDLRTALLAVNTVGSAKLYWIAGVETAKRASVLDAEVFPAMSPTGGEICNLPTIVSSGIPADSLVLIDASGVAADGGPVSVSASSQADVMMDGAPSMNSTTPTPAQMVSMFQSNSTALKADAWFAAEVLRDDAVAVITGVSWGGT